MAGHLLGDDHTVRDNGTTSVCLSDGQQVVGWSLPLSASTRHFGEEEGDESLTVCMCGRSVLGVVMVKGDEEEVFNEAEVEMEVAHHPKHTNTENK